MTLGYNDINRMLIEHCGTNAQGSMDESTIAEGQGGVVTDADGLNGGYFGLCNVRQKYIHGVSKGIVPSSASDFTGGFGFSSVPNVLSYPLTLDCG